jgi:hypothetical protein
MKIDIQKAINHFNKVNKPDKPMTIGSLATTLEVSVNTLKLMQRNTTDKANIKTIVRISEIIGLAICEFVPIDKSKLCGI